MIRTEILLIILVSMLVTWLPRILPYFVVRVVKLPDKAVKFLSFLPITIIFALVLSNVFPAQEKGLPSVEWMELIAIFPTFYVISKTRNVMLSVITGVLCVALLRFLC